MRSRDIRIAVLALAAVVGLGALVLIGRWERDRHAHGVNAAMKAVYARATADGLVSHHLGGYRLDSTFDCLVYAPADKPSASAGLELCFDEDGRLVQAIDRAHGSPRFYSLQEQPSLATVRVPVPKLLKAFVAIGAFADPRLVGVSPHRSTLPVGTPDIGVFHTAP